jgi:uncharacterized membrane protein
MNIYIIYVIIYVIYVISILLFNNIFSFLLLEKLALAFSIRQIIISNKLLNLSNALRP